MNATITLDDLKTSLNGTSPDFARELAKLEAAILLERNRAGAEPPPPVFKSITLAELMARPPKSYLVNGLFGRGETTVIFGAPKSGKTFITIDLLFAMATGGRFAQTFEIPYPLTVCYCTNEGLSGLPNRFRSAADWYNATAADYDRVRFYDNVPQLYDPALPAYVDTFITDYNAEHPTPPDVIIIDTLRNATIGGDENDSGDGAIIYAASQKLVSAYNCAVIWLHHPSRANNGLRGTGALEGFCDAIFKVNAPNQTAGASRTFEYYLAKDAPPFDSLSFTLTCANADPASTVVNWQGVAEANETPQNATQRILGFLRLNAGRWFDAKGIAEALNISQQTAMNKAQILVEDFGVQTQLYDPNKPKSKVNPYIYSIAT